jgi:hypothetical protein
MDTKNYVGNSYKTENEKGLFYTFDVKRESIEALQGVGKRNEIALAIEPKREVKGENYPTHSVYVGEAHSRRELQMLVSKDALLAATPSEYGSIKLFAASRDKVGADLSSFSVALSGKTEEGKYQFVGRGYDEALKFGETMVVGAAYKQEFGPSGEDGKSYNVNIDVEKVKKFTVDAYGDAKLGIVAYTETTPKEDGTMAEQTRYLVTEPGERRKAIEATLSVHVTNPEGKRYPTINECAVHTVGSSEVFKLVVQDRKPQSIGKDCADLVVFENDYAAEMKSMSAEERKAVMGARSYVGRGWTNDPKKIHLSADDLTPEGLAKAIDNNHTIKVVAIAYKKPQVVQEAHVQQVEARLQDPALKTSEALVKVVRNAHENKLEPPKKVSNITFTQEQRDALQAGKAVFVEGLLDKNSKQCDRYITWNKESGRLNYSAEDPALKQAQKQPQQQSKQGKGLKM